MTDHLPSRLGGHVRRHGVAYAALLVAVSFSPVPSLAADLVTASDIARNAITSPKIKNGSVAKVDLKPKARGAKAIRYDLGAHDFATSSYLQRQLPGTWDAATVAASSWQVSLHSDLVNRDYLAPGLGFGGSTNYRVSITPTGTVYIDRDGPGEAYSSIRLYRTVASSSQVATSPTVTAPRTPESRHGRSDR